MLQEDDRAVNLGKQIYKRRSEQAPPSEIILRGLARGRGRSSFEKS